MVLDLPRVSTSSNASLKNVRTSFSFARVGIMIVHAYKSSSDDQLGKRPDSTFSLSDSNSLVRPMNAYCCLSQKPCIKSRTIFSISFKKIRYSEYVAFSLGGIMLRVFFLLFRF